MAVKLDSKYTKAVDAMPLAEYPRPQMRRDSYLCLNGTWQYAILPEFSKLEDYQGDILVPFSPETQLSGVEKTVTPKDALYYKNTSRQSTTTVKSASTGRASARTREASSPSPSTFRRRSTKAKTS